MIASTCHFSTRHILASPSATLDLGRLNRDLRARSVVVLQSPIRNSSRLQAGREEMRMRTRSRVSVSMIDDLPGFLGARGIDFGDALASANLKPEDIGEESESVPLAAYSRLLDVAAEWAKDPTLGLHYS